MTTMLADMIEDYTAPFVVSPSAGSGQALSNHGSWGWSFDKLRMNGLWHGSLEVSA